MEIKAYLSGGMEFAENYGANWRKKVGRWLLETLGHTSFDPVKASEEYLGRNYAGVDFRASKIQNFPMHQEIARKIVELDCMEIILRSSYVICYYDESAQRGAGTKGELTVASIFGKPIYLVTGMPIDKIPSWVIGCADEILSDFESLQNLLQKEYEYAREPGSPAASQGKRVWDSPK